MTAAAVCRLPRHGYRGLRIWPRLLVRPASRPCIWWETFLRPKEAGISRRFSSSHVLRAPYTSSYPVRICRISARISGSARRGPKAAA